ncbi:MAG: glycosyltransferase family 4 protein [Candidatus Komeilibacteria bacterium]|nr:glycosyltransferase family 4 protein [Candidatus Komeilibacteria bacterium]
MPKRILIFSLTYFPFVGGAEVAIKEIIERIDLEKYSFDLITLRFDRALPRTEQRGNLTIHRIGFTAEHPSMTDLGREPLVLNKYFFPFTAFWKALTMHRRKPYDAVWVMLANYAGFGALFFKWVYPNVPMLLSLQEGDPIDHIKHRVRFVYPVFKDIFRKSDAVQAISSHLADFARSMGFEGKSVVVPNGVSTAVFGRQYDVAELAALRADLKIPAKATVLITTSRLVRKNAVDDVIRALPKLPDAYFVVLGTGPDEWSLKLLAQELKVAERVLFVGHVGHEHVPRYLKMADVFIRPSLSEGMGNSFIEAMAAGIPVIATPVGGIVDFLFDPEMNSDKEPTGIFCAVRDPESIVSKVKRLTSDGAVRERIVANAARLSHEQYNWDSLARRMEKEVFAKLFK